MTVRLVALGASDARCSRSDAADSFAMSPTWSAPRPAQLVHVLSRSARSEAPVMPSSSMSATLSAVPHRPIRSERSAAFTTPSRFRSPGVVTAAWAISRVHHAMSFETCSPPAERASAGREA